MKTLSEQVDLLEVNNRNTIYQMKKWREHAESLELRLDNLIDERDNLMEQLGVIEDERDETLLNRDIAEDSVLELVAERDMLAEENKNFAEHLERKDYTFSEVDNIAKGWSVHKEYEDIYDDNYFEGYDEDDLLYDDYEMKDWQTKEGDSIPIYELEDAHLVAIIKLLRRKGGTVPYEMLKEVHVRKLTVYKNMYHKGEE